jgi:hypothetical protein
MAMSRSLFGWTGRCLVRAAPLHAISHRDINRFVLAGLEQVQCRSKSNAKITPRSAHSQAQDRSNILTDRTPKSHLHERSAHPVSVAVDKARLLEGFRIGQPTDTLTHILVEIAGNFARDRRGALRLQ